MIEFTIIAAAVIALVRAAIEIDAARNKRDADRANAQWVAERR